MRQHRALGGRATRAVLADVTVRAHHAVAGDDERQWVAGQRRANGAHRPRPPDLAGDPGVRPDLTPRDLHRLAQRGAREPGETAEVERQVGLLLAGQLTRDLAGRGRRAAASARVTGRPVRSDRIQLEAGGVAGALHERHPGRTPRDVQRPDGSRRARPTNRRIAMPMPSATYRSRKPSPSGSRSSTTNVW